MKGIANPQLKAGRLQIRWNEVNMVKKKSKNSCLKRNILYFCGKINSKTP
jgi:hypothetical protein